MAVKKFSFSSPLLHPGLERAYSSRKRIVLMCCGSGGGKSALGALKTCSKAREYGKDACNIIVAAPTFPILTQSTFYALDQVLPLQGWEFAGAQDKRYWHHRVYKSRIYVRTGTNPNAVEGIPNVRFIWGDEAGQFTRAFWINLQTRSAFGEAQVFLTTTPYTPVWVLKDIIQPIEKFGLRTFKEVVNGTEVEITEGESADAYYINFPSVANPAFSRDEFARQKRILDPLVFARRFLGKYTKMMGLVYQDYGQHLYVKQQRLDAGTVYYAGIDWGYAHSPFAVTIRAVTTSGVQYCVKSFKGFGKTISEKIQIINGFRQVYPIVLFICDKAEPADIAELNKNGLPATASLGNKIEVGIEKHNELIRSGKYMIFEGGHEDLDDEYSTYIRDEDTGIPVDENNDLMDCERYVSEYLAQFATSIKKPLVPKIFRKERKVSNVWET